MDKLLLEHEEQERYLQKIGEDEDRIQENAIREDFEIDSEKNQRRKLLTRIGRQAQELNSLEKEYHELLEQAEKTSTNRTQISFLHHALEALSPVKLRGEPANLHGQVHAVKGYNFWNAERRPKFLSLQVRIRSKNTENNSGITVKPVFQCKISLSALEEYAFDDDDVVQCENGVFSCTVDNRDEWTTMDDVLEIEIFENYRLNDQKMIASRLAWCQRPICSLIDATSSVLLSGGPQQLRDEWISLESSIETLQLQLHVSMQLFLPAQIDQEKESRRERYRLALGITETGDDIVLSSDEEKEKDDDNENHNEEFQSSNKQLQDDLAKEMLDLAMDVNSSPSKSKSTIKTSTPQRKKTRKTDRKKSKAQKKTPRNKVTRRAHDKNRPKTAPQARKSNPQSKKKATSIAKANERLHRNIQSISSEVKRTQLSSSDENHESSHPAKHVRKKGTSSKKISTTSLNRRRFEERVKKENEILRQKLSRMGRESYAYSGKSRPTSAMAKVSQKRKPKKKTGSGKSSNASSSKTSGITKAQRLLMNDLEDLKVRKNAMKEEINANNVLKRKVEGRARKLGKSETLKTTAAIMRERFKGMIDRNAMKKQEFRMLFEKYKDGVDRIQKLVEVSDNAKRRAEMAKKQSAELRIRIQNTRRRQLYLSQTTEARKELQESMNPISRQQNKLDEMESAIRQAKVKLQLVVNRIGESKKDYEEDLADLRHRRDRLVQKCAEKEREIKMIY
eukprot:g2080.t1